MGLELQVKHHSHLTSAWASGDSNSGPHPGIASVLTAVPSSQSKCIIIKYFNDAINKLDTLLLGTTLQPINDTHHF